MHLIYVCIPLFHTGIDTLLIYVISTCFCEYFGLKLLLLLLIPYFVDSEFSTKQSLILTIDTDACKGQDNQVNYLEHVQSFITLKASRRGDVTLYLLSPMNTT